MALSVSYMAWVSITRRFKLTELLVCSGFHRSFCFQHWYRKSMSLTPLRETVCGSWVPSLILTLTLTWRSSREHWCSAFLNDEENWKLEWIMSWTARAIAVGPTEIQWRGTTAFKTDTLQPYSCCEAMLRVLMLHNIFSSIYVQWNLYATQS